MQDKKTHTQNVFEMNEKHEEMDLIDTYHYLNDEEQGEESKATFYRYRHLNKLYHLEHIFAAPGRINELEIGDEDKRLKENDHLPMISEI